MFFIKNCTQTFLTLTNCFSYVRTKTQVTWTYINKDCENVIKFMKITSNSTHNRQKRQKAQNDKKLVF